MLAVFQYTDVTVPELVREQPPVTALFENTVIVESIGKVPIATRWS
tara:strand:- start:309 stop:446 length:138 start_codon:yes stop_codon:yes gene_type:complete